MAEKLKVGCARPTGGKVGEKLNEQTITNEQSAKEEIAMVRVGQKAPDFTAPGYQRDEFVNIHLSEYIGKWVLLCFYPGDFTFV